MRYVNHADLQEFDTATGFTAHCKDITLAQVHNVGQDTGLVMILNDIAVVLRGFPSAQQFPALWGLQRMPHCIECCYIIRSLYTAQKTCLCRFDAQLPQHWLPQVA